MILSFLLLIFSICRSYRCNKSVTESAPELEPVKDMYDAILSFLYGLYDQYNADNNAKWEAAFRQSEEIKQQIGL